MPTRRPIVSKLTALVLVAWLGQVATAMADSHEGIARTPSPAEASLYFISPTNGAVVASPFTVRFGLRGMGVAPAAVDQPKTGHHHLIVDAPLPDMQLPIPMDDHYRHFGGGQTEMQLSLPPGKHTLQLLLGDYRHIPHDPPVVSEQIEITVE